MVEKAGRFVSFLYAAVGFAFFVWWIRGAWIPGAFLAFCCFGLAFGTIALDFLLGERDVIHAATYGNMPALWIGGAVSMLPWFFITTVRRGREERMREALDGIRFNARSAD
ncbi:hypothetical protein [Acidomonas methanolica]|uniref:Uncharacterized protein n=1 Tax=Acidomonas methanolica NBRC 104435 TaxID=1231351 RepID=A0A023D7P8_ACIMT|nr:hypothetical protein [Acidomonas methanolica]TCS24108.1 hypothetical protein EDC31_12529 [Acidomonas methanolica]GAJ29740.1 hypothetical protein Amme_076_033 [Acidomonas methanolica NBRC 104435]GBQ59420.1 hypothetical protein AA0498_2748 [Acidomonas methanolica]GEL00023.1 hypothetical protein AME01nite_25210 [Acidomonas methanolica NBRC 104435]